MLRIRVVIGAAARADRALVLRAAVTADVLRRLAELRGGRALVWHDTDHDTDARTDDATHGHLVPLPELAALNVPPPDEPPVGFAADVEVLAGGDPADPYRRVLTVGPVAGAPPAEADPLAVRLAFLAAGHAGPVALAGGEVGAAEGRLARLRRLVAAAAESPSAPMAAPHVRAVVAALDELDTGAAIARAEAVASDPSLPPGAVFETLAHLDRVLALDLVREVGRPPLDQSNSTNRW